MRSIGTLSGTLFGIVVLGIILSTPALATIKPQFLPEATAKLPVEFSDKHGITHFVEKSGMFEVTCLKGTSTGKVTTLKLGEFSVTFAECTDGTGGCLSLGGEAGKIVMKGALHFWYVLLSGKLQPGLILLLTETHLECGKTLVFIRGCLAGLIKPINEKTKELQSEFREEKGINDVIEAYSEEEVKEKPVVISCKVESSRNGIPFEQQGIETVDTMSGFKQNGKVLELVELMA